MTEQEPVSNEFITAVSIWISQRQKEQLRKYLNLHYLGDVDANEYDGTGNLVAKYPEKETEEYKNALLYADAGHLFNIKVVYDVNGVPKLELLND